MNSLTLKVTVVACACVLVLVACRQQNDVPPSVLAQQSELENGAAPLAGAAVVEEQPSETGVSIAGTRLDLGFEHKVLYDRVDEDGGVRRRKVFVEAIELPSAEIETRVTRAMERQGYALVDRKAALGGHRLDFSKAGAARVVALVRPRLKAGDGPATGIVQFTSSERQAGEPGEQGRTGAAVIE